MPSRPSLPALPASLGGAAATLRRPASLVVMVLVLLALLAGTAAYAVTGKTVSLAVDGEASDVSFRGDTVADALRAAGVSVGEHDSLVPAADATVEDGDRVALRRGRPLELSVDGVSRTVWVTAMDVDEALQQLDLRQDGLFLSASRSRRIPLSGLALEVRTPKSIVIAVDGADRPLVTAAATVGEALAEGAVVPGPLDRVAPAADQPVTEGLRVVVDRVASAQEVEEVVLPFGTERRDDPALLSGTTKELQAGVTGLLRRTVEVVTVNGAVESRTVLGEEQVTAPVARVLAVGTKPKPAPAPAPATAKAAAPAPSSGGSTAPRQATGGADSLNWPALARCESGGNPTIVSSNGMYHGLYQFSTTTWRSVGGSGVASEASPDEQTYRAKLLYNRSGAGQWPTCGKYLFT